MPMVGAGETDEALGQRRTALVSLGAAGVLVALKLGVGLATASLALISAGIESSGDIVAAALTFFAVRLGGRPADPDHPYGHRRAENLGALGEAAILLAGGIVVTVEAVWNGAQGVGGFFERAFAPKGLNRIHDQVLAGLASYVED